MDKTKKCVCGCNMILTSDNHLICENYFENIKRGIEELQNEVEKAGLG